MSLPRMSPVTSQLPCDTCHQKTDTHLFSYSRIHGVGRYKNLCLPCRQSMVTFLRHFRYRTSKKGTHLHLPHQMNVVCPCGKKRTVPWSLIYRYTCLCCRPFIPCSDCFRYVCFKPEGRMAKRAWDTIQQNHAKYVKTDLNHESAVVILAHDALYDTIRNDAALRMYVKDVSIHCLCTLCGTIHCPSTIVYSTTFHNFMCSQCVYLYSLDEQPPPNVEKFIVFIIQDHSLSDVLTCLREYTPITGGDTKDTTLTQFTLGENGTLLIAHGRDQFILGMPLLK